jgi:hypothetical protein
MISYCARNYDVSWGCSVVYDHEFCCGKCIEKIQDG